MVYSIILYYIILYYTVYIYIYILYYSIIAQSYAPDDARLPRHLLHNTTCYVMLSNQTQTNNNKQTKQQI